MCHDSSSEEEASTSQVSSIIDKQLKQDERKIQAQVKLLLLGSHPSPSNHSLGESQLIQVTRCRRQWKINDPQGTFNFSTVICKLMQSSKCGCSMSLMPELL